jgi:copper chaperone CopZ
METTFQAHAPAIHCDACAGAIKRSLGKLPGVQAVDVDVDGKRVSVQYDNAQLSETALRERLALAGFPTE